VLKNFKQNYSGEVFQVRRLVALLLLSTIPPIFGFEMLNANNTSNLGSSLQLMSTRWATLNHILLTSQISAARAGRVPRVHLLLVMALCAEGTQHDNTHSPSLPTVCRTLQRVPTAYRVCTYYYLGRTELIIHIISVTKPFCLYCIESCSACQQRTACTPTTTWAAL
jgi:hypothetical protein